MSIFNIFLSLLFIFTITSGCLSRDEEEYSIGEGCQGRFQVEQVTGTLSFSDETVLPEKFTLDLKACIRSRGRIEKLPGFSFGLSNDKAKLSVPEKEIPESTNLDNKKNKVIKMNSVDDGCIYWTEEYDYAYNDRSQWIKITRHIKGLSNSHPGMCTIPIAVNPWLQLEQHRNNQVADYRSIYSKDNSLLIDRVIKEDGLDFLKRKKKEEKDHTVDIIIDSLTLNMDSSIAQSEKRVLKGNTIEAELRYIIEDIHENRKSRNNKIQAGDFKIEPHLLIEINSIDNGNTIRTEYIKMNKNNISGIKTFFKNDKLESYPFDWKVPFENYNPRAVALYLKVTPIGETAKRVNSFEGIYKIGSSYKKVVLNNKHILNLNAILSSKQYLGRSSNSNNTSDESNHIYNHPNECFEKINPNRNNKGNILIQCISDKTAKLADGSLRTDFGPAGWTAEKMNLRFFQMERENWLSREISTIVETSIYDPLHGTKISRHEIDIEVIDLTTGETTLVKNISTELNGNISFNISTKQNWYQRQRYFLKIIIFRTKTEELKLEKIVAINPWDYGFTHGYEVNHPTKIRTTCLKEEDKTIVSNLLKKETNITNIDEKQLKTIHKIFCHDPSKKTTEDTPEDTSTKETKATNWGSIFNAFKNTLISILRKPFIPNDYFYDKFNSSKDVKKPTAQIHLFRSINKYPTHLIDDSLNRELYYNLRFKLSPRVVRHDDIAIGQQNKGPLRDGVYVFQMAVLKNNQERVSGEQSMVQSRETFSMYNNANEQKAGTTSLYCPTNQQNCVKAPSKEDFLIPPTNLPVVIREGMVKTDVLTLIKREHLLFANSKNILVFRVIPADPKTVVCKNRDTECTMKESEYDDTYETAFDWKETIKTIKPADPDRDYDMIFYTYKTPFIPSLWANWNITHEMDITFDDLQNIYENLLDEDIKAALQNDPSSENSTVKLSDAEQIHTTLSTPDRVARNQDTLQSRIHSEVLDAKRAYVAEAGKALVNTPDAIDKQIITDVIARTQAEIDAANGAPHTTTPDPTTLAPQLEKLTDAEADAVLSVNTESPTDIDEPPTDTPQDRDYCQKVQMGEQEYSTEQNDNERCAVDKANEDMSQKHINQFVSTHTLCTMNIKSGLSLTDKSCGRFPSAGDAQQSFVDDLNRQINLINENIKEVRELDQQLNRYPVLSSQKEADTQEEQPEKPMEEAFQKEHRNSQVVANKIKNTPELPLLNADDLENIILSNINEDTIRDKKTGAFLHALCGFWFENFFSNKYTNKDLLLGGVRQFVKQSFYYKLKGITSMPHERDNILMQNFQAGLEEVKKDYDEYLSNQRIKGNIDDLHKWVNNEEGYGFDSSFNQELYNKFQSISNRTPLTNTTPSWVDTDPDTVQNTFNAQDYLDEAIEATKNRRTGLSLHTLRYGDDNHPFRKCIMNPSHFFGLEKKIIVGKVDDRVKYGSANGTGGETTTLSISEAFLMNTQRDQGANQDFSIRSDLMFLTLPFLAFGIVGGAIPILFRGFASIAKFITRGRLPQLPAQLKTALSRRSRIFTPVVSATALAWSGILGGYTYRMYEGTGKRRWLSVQVVETVELISERTPVRVGLKNYHECLVIRPRFSAFESHTDKYAHIWAEKNKVLRSIYEKMGILLCTQGKEEISYIDEVYYYIYPNYAINGITIDPSSHRNKPFTISLRGTKEYKRFLSNLSCDVSETKEPIRTNKDCRDTRGKYENLFLKNIEFARNLRAGFDTPKMFHLTGDLPGVHSPYKEPKDREARVDTHWVHDIINWMSDQQFFDMDLEKVVKKEPVD